MSVYDKTQPLLDRLTVEAIGETPSDDDAIAFANALVSRAAGIVFATVNPLADRHAVVAMWFDLWRTTAESRSEIIEAHHVRH